MRAPTLAAISLPIIFCAGCLATHSLGHGQTLIVRPRISGGHQTQATLNPYTAASIQHLLIKLYRYDGIEHDLGISQDLLNAQLTNPITFANLKANTTYRIKAHAYKATGTAPVDLISDESSASFVDVLVGSDDRPGITTLPVQLINIPFNGQATSSLSIIPGGYSAIASESSYSQFPSIRGIVSTLAGSGAGGYQNGTGASAMFNTPWGIDADSQGNLIVSDRANHCIRKITPTGVVTTIAGTPGASGFADGNGTNAKFRDPHGLIVNRTTNDIYVADCFNDRIRKITPAGDVTTFVGNGTASHLDGTGVQAKVNRPVDLAIDSTGNLYLADYSNNRVRKITPTGVVTTIAGGSMGHQDGYGTNAQFYFPYGITLDNRGNLYVAEVPQTIRKITPLGEVTTIAGSYFATGSVDGLGTNARFNTPIGLKADANGYLFIPDRGNHRLRVMDPAGNVTTLVGRVAGNTSGTGTAALLNNPFGVAFDNQGQLYLTESHSIRKIQ